MAGPRTRFYRDKRHGKVSGVCAGLADYFGLDVTLVRVATVGSFFLLGPLLFFAYFLLVAIAPKRPLELERLDQDEKRFWQKVRRNPRATARSVRARFRDIDRRLAHTEAHFTSPDRRLAREIDQLR